MRQYVICSDWLKHNLCTRQVNKNLVSYMYILNGQSKHKLK